MKRALVLMVVAGSLGLTACVGGPPAPAPPPQQLPSACAGAGPAQTESPAAEPEDPADRSPMTREEAAAEAREEVAESEQRTANGSAPLVTYEQTPNGPEITTTPVGSPDVAAAVAEEAAADGDLLAVEVDAPVAADSHNDPTTQYALDATHLRIEDAWGAFAPNPFSAGNPQVIAVIDTGVQASHPDLTPRVLGGRFFLHSNDGGTAFSGSGGTSDGNGHGTHVAGIAAATANNNAGIAGVAPGARILPVQVLCANGEGFSSDVAAGVNWAAQNGATVINLSLGSSTNSSVLHAAIQNAVSSGVSVIAAGGNCTPGVTSCTSFSYPGAFNEVISAAATDSANARASFSISNNQIDIAAPGVGIVSTLNNGGYGNKNGTSMAAPHVAGSAALVRAKGCNRAQTEARLRSTAENLGPSGVDNDTGHGLVRPDQAVLTCV